MTEFTIIKRTQLSDFIIVTAKRSNPNLVRPFTTFAVNGSSPFATRISDFASKAAALAEHDSRIARMKEEDRGK